MENLCETIQMADVIVRSVLGTFDFSYETFGYPEVKGDVVL